MGPRLVFFLSLFQRCDKRALSASGITATNRLDIWHHSAMSGQRSELVRFGWQI
jgi:hypothetical protein